ncbi:putative 12-oxophytodienoate reductase 11 [Tanacetum coccineum]
MSVALFYGVSGMLTINMDYMSYGKQAHMRLFSVSSRHIPCYVANRHWHDQPRMVTKLERMETRNRFVAMRKVFKGTFMVAGGYHDRDEANRVVENGDANLVAFGRAFNWIIGLGE